MSAQSSDTDGHHLDPCPHLAVDDLCVHRGGILHHKIRIQQAFLIQSMHKCQIFAVAVLGWAVLNCAVLAQRKIASHAWHAHNGQRDVEC